MNKIKVGNLDRIVQSLRNQTLNEVNRWKPSILDLDRETLRSRTIESYNRAQKKKGSTAVANSDSPEFFLRRLEFNYLRHRTSYDSKYSAIENHIGFSLAYIEMCRKICDEIIRKYPHLARTANEWFEQKLGQ